MNDPEQVHEQQNVGVFESQGNRRYMEDRWHINVLQETDGKRYVFYAVYDGHGGSSCSIYLQKNLHQAIQEQATFPNRMDRALTSAIEVVDEKFFESHPPDVARDEGSTVNCAVIEYEGEIPKRVWVANCGDSRAVLGKLADDGQAVVSVELSDDHKPSREDEKKRIESRGGIVKKFGVSTDFQFAITGSKRR